MNINPILLQESANPFFEIGNVLLPSIMVVVIMAGFIGALAFVRSGSAKAFIYGLGYTFIYLAGVTGNSIVVWVVSITLALYVAWVYTTRYF